MWQDLSRVACYLCDIGETEHPFFFIENLPAHKMIGPYESKEVIFDHVRKGGRNPETTSITDSDCNAEHMGDEIFLLLKLKGQSDGRISDIRSKPQTKSAVISWMAGAATQSKVQNLLHSIIMNRLEDEQFVE